MSLRWTVGTLESGSRKSREANGRLFLVARTSARRYPLPHEREPADDDAAPRAAFGRRIARGITQQQATS
jgi:hypothetical protein